MKSSDSTSSFSSIGPIALLCAMLFFVQVGAADTAVDDSAGVSPPPGSYRLLDSDGKIEIPFEIFRGDIRFQCKVNGHQTHMLLDDGFMWDELLFWGHPEVDSLGLIYDGEVSIGNDTTGLLASKTASGITVTFPGVEFTDQTAIVTPESSGNSSMWWGSIGQLSATFFKHFVVDINFDKMIITLTEPNKFGYQGEGVAVPWEPLGFGPWSIPATLQIDDEREISMPLLMDLGYNDQLQLVVGGEHNITLPEKKLPVSLGFNIQRQETRGYVGRLSGIDIGGYRVDDVIVGFVAAEHSDHTFSEAMIGLGLLSRFNLVFDYHNQRLFIEPNISFDNPFEYNMSGFVMRAAPGGSHTITAIHADSPAEAAGLMVGDEIFEINGREIGSYDFFELQAMFKQAGERVTLLTVRDGEEKPVTLTLRRVI